MKPLSERHVKADMLDAQLKALKLMKYLSVKGGVEITPFLGERSAQKGI